MAYSGNRQLPGLRPIGNGVAGTAPRVRKYEIPAAYYATSIGEGNLLIKTATGVQLALTTTIVATMANVIGVAAHNVLAVSASAKRYVLVYDDPEQEFAIIADGTMTTTVQAEMVGQFSVFLTNTYSTTYEQGKTELDISEVTGSLNTTRLQLQITGVPGIVGEVATSAYEQVVVKIPNAVHVLSSARVGRPT